MRRADRRLGLEMRATRRAVVGGFGAVVGARAVGRRSGWAQAGEQIEHPMGSEEVVLRVESGGGLMPPQYLVMQMPSFVLYGDGLVVTQGPVIAIYPPPALPNLRQMRLSEAGIQAVLVEAQRAGLLKEDLFLRTDMVMDAPTTTFTTTAGGKTTVVSAYALMPEPPAGTSGAVAEQYRKLGEFQTKLNTLADWLPADGIAEPDADFNITRIQIVSIPVDSLQVPLDEGQSTVDWPLGTGLADLGEPVANTPAQYAGMPEFAAARCAVIEGDDAATLVAALNQANSQTPWDSSGVQFALFPRPLLPGEVGCPPEQMTGATPEA
jgi:hypothetical protein